MSFLRKLLRTGSAPPPRCPPVLPEAPSSRPPVIPQRVRRIALISCGKTKLPHSSSAEILYTSPLFKLSLAYAKRLQPDAIYILSAKHHLLPLAQQVAPYDLTLKKMTGHEQAQWAHTVLGQLRSVSNINTDHFIILAGIAYYARLIQHLPNHSLPLDGLGLGQRMQFLTRVLAEPALSP